MLFHYIVTVVLFWKLSEIFEPHCSFILVFSFLTNFWLNEQYVFQKQLFVSVLLWFKKTNTYFQIETVYKVMFARCRRSWTPDWTIAWTRWWSRGWSESWKTSTRSTTSAGSKRRTAAPSESWLTLLSLLLLSWPVYLGRLLFLLPTILNPQTIFFVLDAGRGLTLEKKIISFEDSKEILRGVRERRGWVIQEIYRSISNTEFNELIKFESKLCSQYIGPNGIPTKICLRCQTMSWHRS